MKDFSDDVVLYLTLVLFVFGPANPICHFIIPFSLYPTLASLEGWRKRVEKKVLESSGVLCGAVVGSDEEVFSTALSAGNPVVENEISLFFCHVVREVESAFDLGVVGDAC